MKFSPAIRLLVSLLSLLVLPGCGYTLEGRGNFLPKNIHTVSFPTFTNATGRVGLEQRLSSAVARELASRGNFKVTSRDGIGEAELNGEITSLALIPSNVDALGRATQYQIVISLKVSLTTLPAGKILWKNDSYTFRQTYDTAGANVSAANFADLENQAIDAEADLFARSLVTSILEGF